MNTDSQSLAAEERENPGRFETYQARDVIPDMSFLEMLDVVNEDLIASGEEPIAFDSDCREGICGMCSLVINGIPHGGHRGTATCQLHMRHFKDGDTVTIEPWRAKAFPIIKDLVTDRSAFDRIIQAGGFVSVNTGGTPDANALPVPKTDAGPRHGRRRLHRLRRLRRGLQECLRHALCRRQGLPSQPAAPRQSRKDRVRSTWSSRWTRKASATAPSPAPAKPFAPRKSASTSSPR